MRTRTAAVDLAESEQGKAKGVSTWKRGCARTESVWYMEHRHTVVSSPRAHCLWSTGWNDEYGMKWNMQRVNIGDDKRPKTIPKATGQIDSRSAGSFGRDLKTKMDGMERQSDTMGSDRIG